MVRTVASNRRLMCAALCVSVAVSATAANPSKAKSTPKPVVHKIHVDQAYYAGDLVKLHTAAPEAHEAYVTVGPWSLGPRVATQPSDKRPNLYFVVPGSLHQTAEYPTFSHTLILSSAPEDPKEFDIYWAVVLDPSLKDDFNSERQLILATQQTFAPGDDFSFDQIPSAGFLREFLKVNTLADLDKYKHPDGKLPRMAIITAHKAVRFSVEQPETPAAATATSTAPAADTPATTTADSAH
jgi:hypothetical protein